VEGLASQAALALENAIAGQRLGELEQFKSDFLNLAAHELRGPVAIARGYLEMLGEDIDRWRPSQRESMLRVTRNKLDQIRYLVDRMLETARLEERKPDLQLDTVDLRQLLGEATAATAYAVKPEHRFAVDTCDRPVLVRVDRDRMRGAIANLLENACKYSRTADRFGPGCGWSEPNGGPRSRSRTTVSASTRETCPDSSADSGAS
jgi:signal transduction histidine kinase